MNHPPIEAIAMGASSGAVEAIGAILKKLPESYPIPIFIVVHLPPDRASALVDVFQIKSSIPIREAEDKEPVHKNAAYVAPPDYHLLIEPDKRLSLSNEEPVHFSRPSIDVLFETAADAYAESLVGIVLTGGNCDGAQGLRRIWELGGTAIVQSPHSASVSAMPEAALAACPAAREMDLEQIADFLNELGKIDD